MYVVTIIKFICLDSVSTLILPIPHNVKSKLVYRLLNAAMTNKQPALLISQYSVFSASFTFLTVEKSKVRLNTFLKLSIHSITIKHLLYCTKCGRYN